MFSYISVDIEFLRRNFGYAERVAYPCMHMSYIEASLPLSHPFSDFRLRFFRRLQANHTAFVAYFFRYYKCADDTCGSSDDYDVPVFHK